jgi:hypothetical protein
MMRLAIAACSSSPGKSLSRKRAARAGELVFDAPTQYEIGSFCTGRSGFGLVSAQRRSVLIAFLKTL